jgi:hypothetical protein
MVVPQLSTILEILRDMYHGQTIFEYIRTSTLADITPDRARYEKVPSCFFVDRKEGESLLEGCLRYGFIHGLAVAPNTRQNYDIVWANYDLTTENCWIFPFFMLTNNKTALMRMKLELPFPNEYFCLTKEHLYDA